MPLNFIVYLYTRIYYYEPQLSKSNWHPQAFNQENAKTLLQEKGHLAIIIGYWHPQNKKAKSIHHLSFVLACFPQHPLILSLRYIRESELTPRKGRN